MLMAFAFGGSRDVGGFRDALASAVYGQAVGDALGVPFEFKRRDDFICTDMTGHGMHDQPAGTWSDDTSMTLATLDSLASNGGRVDAGDMLARFRSWLDDGAYTPGGVVFDVGSTTAKAIRIGHGLSGKWDNGNGSLMRIVPLAFTGCTDDDVRTASAVTHANPISTEACVRFVHVARMLLAGETSIDRLSEAAGVKRLTVTPRSQIASGGFVLDTVRAALWCLATTHCYADCVLAAVNLGDDSDTTASVAGAIAGIRYGLDANPWRGRLRNTALIERIIDKAANSFAEDDVS